MLFTIYVYMYVFRLINSTSHIKHTEEEMKTGNKKKNYEDIRSKERNNISCENRNQCGLY